MNWRPDPHRQNASVASAVDEHMAGQREAEQLLERIRSQANVGDELERAIVNVALRPPAFRGGWARVLQKVLERSAR